MIGFPGRRPSGACLLPALLVLTLQLAGAAPETGSSPDDPKRAERLDPRDAGAEDTIALELGPRERVVVDEGRDLFLEVRPGPGDTHASLGRRYLARQDQLSVVREINGAKMPPSGASIRIPYGILNDDTRARVMHDLFPDDGPRAEDWFHRVGAGRMAGVEESLWSIALWYTGRGENFEALADRNALPDLSPQDGQEIRIPGNLLLPPFAERAAKNSAGARATGADTTQTQEESGGDADDFTEASPGPEAEEEGPPPGDQAPVPPAPGAEDLTYDKDKQGPFAVYRLKRGEALYSSVVVRYTGSVDAREVKDLARQIARRSGIRDVTDIPIGFRVKIPLDDLLPQYLPPGDPRRKAWERGRAEVARYSNQARSRDLAGVAVILDAGHGGLDRGTSHNGVWEHDYVYDILCRIKALLETKTRARVLTTIRDRKEGYRIHNKTRLPRSRAEILLTTPHLRLKRGRMSVNLRWYLSNSYYRSLVAEGFDPLKIVFTSIHADARHPALRGAMVYVPGEEYRRGRYGFGSAAYARYKEVREAPYVRFARKDRKRSEGLSRQFASTLIRSFRKAGVPIHPHLPIRERIIRRRRSFVPAVLRCNLVPVQVLLEINNLSNRADSRLLKSPKHRQKVAEAYVESLHRYYSDRGKPRTNTARRGR